jgi:outer membrane protein assembly factor BamA
VADLGHPLGAGLLLKGFLETRFVEMTAFEATGGGPPDPDVLPPDLAGYRGGWDGLLGLALEFDTRDDESLPSRGWHAGQRVGRSPPGLDYGYAALETWTAAYAAPHPRWETAVKVQQATVLGRAPFYAYPYLGDKRLLRGISEKRLRDRSAQAAQAEVRWGFRLALPLIARYFGEDWQVAAFGGAGRVGEDFRSALGETLHWAGGVGGRLIIGRRLGALRGDLGFSRSGYGLYVDFNQAF